MGCQCARHTQKPGKCFAAPNSRCHSRKREIGIEQKSNKRKGWRVVAHRWETSSRWMVLLTIFISSINLSFYRTTSFWWLPNVVVCQQLTWSGQENLLGKARLVSCFVDNAIYSEIRNHYETLFNTRLLKRLHSAGNIYILFL